ncbi:MAG: hypothetical protein KBD46_00265 [Candidatus Levybacteria bacterium]|nr:hypothetical protein [Candidatus Levybacteria bacterium]
MHTQYTTADIFDEEVVQHNQVIATTLAFSQKNTANNNTTSSLFHTNGLQSDGFDLAAIRVKKSGKMNFTYRVKIDEIVPSTLCKNLVLQVMYKKEFIYEGALINFVKDETMTQEKPQDWIYFLSLPSNAAMLKQQSCDFNIHFKTWRGNPESKKGFYDENVISNTITTGNW